MARIKTAATIAAATLFLTQFGALAAQKASSRPKPATAAAAWTPMAFDPSQQSLPPNFAGVDRKKFLRLFESKVESIKKDEYETTEQFQARLSNAGGLLAPISTEALYAFQIEELKLRYDADKQEFVVDNYYSCAKTSDFGESKGWVTCKLGPVIREFSSYVGSNAYGASMKVDKVFGKDLAIAVKPESSFLATSGFEHSQYSSRYSWKTAFSMPLDQARALKGLEIRALVVGRVSAAKLVEGQALLVDPKIDSPRDVFVLQPAIPFEPLKIIYYAAQTGEILNSQSL